MHPVSVREKEKQELKVQKEKETKSLPSVQCKLREQESRGSASMCRDFNIDPASYIDNGSTEDQVRAAILENLESTGAPVSTGVRVTETAEDKYRSAAVDALLMRGGVEVENPADGARNLMGMSLRDMAIDCLSQDGKNEGLNRRSADELYAMLQKKDL